MCMTTDNRQSPVLSFIISECISPYINVSKVSSYADVAFVTVWIFQFHFPNRVREEST